MSARSLTVVVPALDEADNLPALLADLRAQHDVTVQVVVADGGSRDATRSLAQAAGARVVEASRGRAAQMNAAVAETRGRRLLFLHADTRLPARGTLRAALDAFELAARRAGHRRLAGHFALQFSRSEPGHELLFRYLEAKSALNRPWTFNGDQGLLIDRAWLAELGGFDASLPFLEDQRLGARIRDAGAFVTLPGVLQTSARRFEREGHAERYTLMAIIMALHAAGLDELLAAAPRFYRAQAQSTRLDLHAARRVVAQALRALPPGRRAGAWLAAGAFARANAWQLACLLDVLRSGRPGGALQWFDRRIAPWLDNPAADVAGALATALWFHVALPLALARRRTSAAPRHDRESVVVPLAPLRRAREGGGRSAS